MSFPGPAALDPHLDPVSLPPLARVRYDPPTPTIDDIPGRIDDALESIVGEIPPGGTVAIGVGSRGIAEIDRITRYTVVWLSDHGFEPVIVPAMGSHGGGTADGQLAVLEELGISPSTVDCPFEPTMATASVGSVSIGNREIEIPIATPALRADAVLPINRIAPHTSFTGRIESGIAKMLVVGFGKQPGASQLHRFARTHGFVTTVEAMLPVILDAVPVPGGLAIVENGANEVADIVAIPGDDVLAVEADVLPRARDLLPTLPFDRIDLLVVDTMGKDISGTGMDPNVIGRPGTGDPPPPGAATIDRIYVRSLSSGSKGNANGIGLADAVHRDLYETMDTEATYANVLTSGYPGKAAIPMVFPTDEQAITALVGSLGAIDSEDLRMAWIPDTGSLSEFYASSALLESVDDPTIRLEGWIESAFPDGVLDRISME